MSLKLPSFCFQKAFWILLGLMVTGGLSIGSWGWALVDEIRETSLENAFELKEREQAVSLIPDIYRNQIVICEKLDANCK